jgi:hypothetical protein
MAYSSIVKPSDYFNTKLYTGNGSTQSITGVGFQPDWTWIKNRTAVGEGHHLYDAVRGVEKRIRSDSTTAESTVSTGLTAFGTDGFTVGTNAGVNGNGNSIASWNWLANGQGSSNTDGSINTTYTSVNTTAGFSISKYTGTGSNATVGHGLGVAPNMVLVKSLSGGGDWTSYHSVLGNTKFMRLNSTNAVGTQSTYWNDTSPTSTVFSLGSAGDTNTNGGTHVAYCFANKKGYSKFGSYVGTNNGANGPFIYTGFKPAFILIKNTTSSADWHIRDNKRDTYNASTHFLKPNSSDAEVTSGEAIDILSNGFKIKANGLKVQDSGNTYIYMAFAEEPLVANSGTDGVPATAR